MTTKQFDTTVTVRLDAETVERLDLELEQRRETGQRWTRSDLVRVYVTEGLRKPAGGGA